MVVVGVVVMVVVVVVVVMVWFIDWLIDGLEYGGVEVAVVALVVVVVAVNPYSYSSCKGKRAAHQLWPAGYVILDWFLRSKLPISILPVSLYLSSVQDFAYHWIFDVWRWVGS